MNAAQQALYRRIEQFQIDEPGVELTFARRLARENGWTLAYAHRVIGQYKCFLFLAMEAGHVVSPSEQVDQAWHLHLTYTRSYWEGLCREVLGRPLHHGPTKGGHEEQTKYIDLYNQTLASYEKLFGHAPPRDIWPDAATRFGTDLHQVRVNTARHWIIPKPTLPRPLRSLRRAVGIPVAGLALSVPLALTNPLDMKGPEFLGLYLVLAVIALIFAAIVRQMFRPSGDIEELSKRGELDPYEVACLAGKPVRAVQAAIAAMVQAGTLTLSERPSGFWGGLFSSRQTYVGPGEPHVDSAPRLEQEIFRAVAHSELSVPDLTKEMLPLAQELEEQLIKQGLVAQREWLPLGNLVSAAIMASPLCLGVLKIMVGLSREKPVGILIALCIFTAIGAAMFLFAQSYRTRLGDKWLSKLQHEYDSMRTMAGKADSGLAAQDMALAVGLFGVAALATGPLDLLYRAVPSAHGSNWSGGGCGTGCGGGGCGGGGCGGGCGGCGG
jgi:uncharacterized protein (TIGR04222 family)